MLLFALLAFGGAACDSRRAPASEPLRLAVAANFAPTGRKLAESFERTRGVAVELSSGSTGKLYAQIKNGAPFQLFFAADRARPALLEREAMAEPGSRFTYARGRLVLYVQSGTSADGLSRLKDGTFRHLAIANPEVAPYGAAALQALERLGALRAASSKLVRGQDVSQAVHFVDSGAAELGLVALSAVIHGARDRYQILPAHLYEPIEQDALVLVGAGERAARFMDYVKSESGRRIVEADGYEVP